MTAATTYFMDYQKVWLTDDSRQKVAEKSRRIGWTYTQAYEDMRDAAKEGGMDVWFSSADLTAAREYIRYVEMWSKLGNAVAKDLGEIVIQGEGNDAIKAFAVEYANGKRINALSSNPKGFRSKGGKVVLDEFAFHEQPDELWRAAAPSVLWGFPIRVFSSHNGRDTRFNRLVEEAKQPGGNWSLHSVNIIDAMNDGLVERILKLDRVATPAERDAFLAECRSIAGDEETFQQEFMVNPLDGTEAYIPYALYDANVGLDVPEPLVLQGTELHQIPLDLYRPFLAFKREGGRLFLGVDIGRKRDLTVLWLWEEVGGKLVTRAVVELHVVKFRYQYAWLRHLLPLVVHCEIDETGLGAQLAEDAQEDFGEERVTKVTFSEYEKRDLAVGMKNLLEDGGARLPAALVVKADFRKIRRVTSPNGNVLFKGERDADGHADRWWAAALGVRASKHKIGGGIITL